MCLRRGNIVMDLASKMDGKDDFYCSVTLVDETNNVYSRSILPNGAEQPTIKSITKYVLLTEEWHNKFGIKMNGHMSFEYLIRESKFGYTKIIFSGDYVYIRQSVNNFVSDDSLVTIWNNDIKKRGMYVHEFQNLYMVLKGEELFINNEL